MKPILSSQYLDRLRNDIDRSVENVVSMFRGDERDRDFASFSGNGPRIDVEEDEVEVRVTAEMPGLGPDDFNVELLGQRLVISGEKKCERKEDSKGYYYSECSYGSFSRSISLPAEVQPDQVQAEYKDGLLKVRLPKSEKAKASRIKVDVK